MRVREVPPTKIKTFGGERYRLFECYTDKRTAEKEAVLWRGKGYYVRVVTYDGIGILPRVKHYCLYYHPRKGRRSK